MKSNLVSDSKESLKDEKNDLKNKKYKFWRRMNPSELKQFFLFFGLSFLVISTIITMIILPLVGLMLLPIVAIACSSIILVIMKHKLNNEAGKMNDEVDRQIDFILKGTGVLSLNHRSNSFSSLRSQKIKDNTSHVQQESEDTSNLEKRSGTNSGKNDKSLFSSFFPSGSEEKGSDLIEDNKITSSQSCRK